MPLKIMENGALMILSKSLVDLHEIQSSLVRMCFVHSF